MCLIYVAQRATGTRGRRLGNAVARCRGTRTSRQPPYLVGGDATQQRSGGEEERKGNEHVRQEAPGIKWTVK